MAKPRSEFTLWWWVGVPPFYLMFKLLFSWRIHRLNEIPADGAVLLAPNHMSFLDPIFVALSVARRGRTIRFLAAAEFFDKGIVGWGLKRMQQIPLRRGQRDEGALDAAKAALRDGAIVGIFPEGKINDDPVTLLPGRRGAARLAIETNTPIVPVGVWGPHFRLPRHGVTKTLPLRTRISVIIGDPIYPDPTDETEGALERLTDEVMVQIARLRDIARADTERRKGARPGRP